MQKIDYKNQIKVVGFDMDQTLYEKSPEIDEAIQEYLYEKIAKKYNCSKKEAKELFQEHYKYGSGIGGGSTMNILGFENGKELVQEALENADIAKFLTPNAEKTEMLKQISQNYVLDLITGSYKKQVERRFEKMEIPIELFNNVITQDIASKNLGDAYKIWLSYYPEFAFGEFLYVGDRVSSDFIIPKEMGINSILVNQSLVDESLSCPQLTNLFGVKEYLI